MKHPQQASKPGWLSGSVAFAFTAAAGAAALLPAAAQAAPQFDFTAPAVGGVLSGDVKGPDSATPCVVEGTDIARVMFYLNDQWTNTDGRLENGLGCWVDTTKYRDGSYTLKAVAYNAAGESSTKTREIRIQNGTIADDGEDNASGGQTSGAPTVAFTAPAVGGVLSGVVKGPDSTTPCVVQGTNIAKVMFYLNNVWTNTDGNLSNGLGCWIDTTKYPDGAYTLKAVAYNSAGQTATATHSVQIKNSTSSSTAPTVYFTAPAEGGTLSGNVQGPPSCVVQGSNIARVMFYLNNTWTNTDGNLSNGLGCWIDTTKYANGTYTVKAVAYNSAGQATSATRSITIKNGTTTTPTTDSGSTTSSIASADIIGQAREDIPFSNQSGYSGQILGTYPSASSIPESGIHGSRLSNGETLRLGKDPDPTNSSKKALSFQLHPNDTSTSGSKRAEISFVKNIEHNKVYWVAYKVFLRDWGTLASNDTSIFGTQLHSGDNSRGLSPSFSMVANQNGRYFQIYTVTSTSTSPSQGNSVTTRHASTPIPFGRWVDFVYQVRQNTSGAGFLRVWMDGKQILNYTGNIGFKTPGYKDYMKFGYYNWSSGFNSARKVMMRKPTIVLDPTGSKYTAADLRAHINK